MRVCSRVLDVPTWLKSLRLHKYASLFSQMSYEEMMVLTEQHLESQVCAAPCVSLCLFFCFSDGGFSRIN